MLQFFLGQIGFDSILMIKKCKYGNDIIPIQNLYQIIAGNELAMAA